MRTQRARNHALNRLAIASAWFLIVYVLIHIFLNHEVPTCERPSNRSFETAIEQVLGPFTISLCSTLLIFCYGMFALHGARLFLVSAPSAFIDAFVIFVFGQIAVQIAGHSEIYVNSCVAAWPFKLLATLSYPFALGCLCIFENYESRLLRNLLFQLPRSEQWRFANVNIRLSLTVFAVLLAVAKFAIAEITSSDEAKLAVTVIVLFADVLLTIGAISLSLKARFSLVEGSK